MKNKHIVSIILLTLVVVFFVVYRFDFKIEKNCTLDQGCLSKGIICDQKGNRKGDQPICVERDLATGKLYPKPICMCLNPMNKYQYSDKQISKVGRIILFGNEPFTQLGLEVEGDQTYCLTGPLKKELWEKYQHETIIIEGKFTEEFCSGTKDDLGSIEVSSFKIR